MIKIGGTIEENLPEEEEQSEWNWSAMANFLHARWGLRLTGQVS